MGPLPWRRERAATCRDAASRHRCGHPGRAGRCRRENRQPVGAARTHASPQNPARGRERTDLLGYAYPFLFEMAPQITATIRQAVTKGARVRIAVADPDCPHVVERDALEQLGGTLAGRIRVALMWLSQLDGLVDANVGMHQVHLYNSVFRIDNQMIVTPHLFRAHP